MDIVKDVMKKARKDLDTFKPIQVSKHVDVKMDLGELLLSDPNDIDNKQYKINRNNYLLDLTRDNVQLLLNSIWELPTEKVEESIVARLPQPTLVLPRIRKCPVSTPVTKWKKFAQEKGIKQSKYKDKKIFDETLNKWVPRYGFKRVQAEKEKDWVLEVPKTANPMEDQFKKRIDLRDEKVAKNEYQRMKNIVRAKQLQVPRAGYLGPDAASAKQLVTAATIAKASTASVGKFQDKLPKERPARGLGVAELIPGAKRKASHISEDSEKTMNLKLINSVLNKKPKFDVDKAISLQKNEAYKEQKSQSKNQGKRNKKSNRKFKNQGKKIKRRNGAKKPKGGKGERNPKRKTSGRKRR